MRTINREWNTYVRALSDETLEELISITDRCITDAGNENMEEIVINLCQVREGLCEEHMRRNEEMDHIF